MTLYIHRCIIKIQGKGNLSKQNEEEKSIRKEEKPWRMRKARK